jgi:hypothetical protein
MLEHLCTTVGLATTLWIADPAAVETAAALHQSAGQAAQEARPPAADAPPPAPDQRALDNGGPELRLSVLGGTFEGPVFGFEGSAALFTPPREDRPVQFGFEAQVRYANDTDPEGTLEDASLTAFTGNLVLRGAHGRFRPYAGVGAGMERYYYNSTFSDTTGSISGFVYQGFAGTTIDIRRNVFLDLRLTLSDRDYDETTTTSNGFVTRTETIYARDVSFTASFGIGIRL